MQDRQSMNPNRITFTDENSGTTYTGTWAYADNPVVDGTLMNKAAFLQDATATAIGLTQDDPTVNDALAKLQTNINTKVNSSSVGAASGVAALDANSKISPSQASSRTVSFSTSRNLTLSDAGTMIYNNSSSNLVITIPANSSVSFPIGTEIEFLRWETGTFTISADTGVTLKSFNNKYAIAHQYGCAALKKITTDGWILAGDL